MSLKIVPILGQMISRLPQYTDAFSDNLNIVTITKGLDVLNITTGTNHNLSPGNPLHITGTRAVIEASGASVVGGITTITTTIAHDLTRGEENTIEILDNSLLQGTWKVLDVKDRFTFTIATPEIADVQIIQTFPVLGIANAFQEINKLHFVETVVSPTQFTIKDSTPGLPVPILEDAQVRTRFKITTTVTPERFMELYDQGFKGKDNIPQPWLAIVASDGIASKDRAIRQEVSSNSHSKSEHLRQSVVYNFSVFGIYPSQEDPTGTTAREKAADMLVAINKAVLRAKLPVSTALSQQGLAAFARSAGFDYNTAYYTHEYAYTVVVDLTTEDAVDPDTSVAFRDIDMTLAQTQAALLTDAALNTNIELDK